MNKSSRRYSLFEKRNGKWVRISFYAYTLKIARNLYQDIMFNGALSGKDMMLRAVRD